MNRKGKPLNKQCFYRNNKMLMFSGIKCSNACSNAVYRHWHSPTIVVTRLLPCRWYVVRSQRRNLLFRCVKSLVLLWKPHGWF